METSSRTVTLPTGITLHLREGGQGGPTVLLLHGWTVSGVVWEPLLARWPEDAGRLLAPDLRGTGWSAKPREGYALADDVADVVALLDALGLEDLVLVGHSKGGTIAQRVALDRPKALRGLVLVSPVPACGVPLDDGAIGYLRSLCGHREGAERLVCDMIAAPVEPALRARLIESVATVCLESQLGGFDAFRTANFADAIGGITTPTRVISGGAEQLLSPALMEAEVIARIPGATLRVIDGSGHYPQVEAPDAFAAALREAVASFAPPSSAS